MVRTARALEPASMEARQSNMRSSVRRKTAEGMVSACNDAAKSASSALGWLGVVMMLRSSSLQWLIHLSRLCLMLRLLPSRLDTPEKIYDYRDTARGRACLG